MYRFSGNIFRKGPGSVTATAKAVGSHRFSGSNPEKAQTLFLIRISVQPLYIYQFLSLYLDLLLIYEEENPRREFQDFRNHLPRIKLGFDA